MSDKSLSHEAGHLNILGTTVLAAVSVIILAAGAANDNGTLVWIGGIAAALFLIGQFILIHAEMGRLWNKIDALSK